MNDDCVHGPWLLDTATCDCLGKPEMHIYCNDCGAIQVQDEWKEH